MRLKNRLDQIKKATLTTDHAASSYGQPVLVIDREPYGTFDASLNNLRIVEATDEEREALKAAGYHLQDA